MTSPGGFFLLRVIPAEAGKGKRKDLNSLFGRRGKKEA
jgi:hypothetical protein